MIMLVSSREKTFTFINETNGNDVSYYTVAVRVDEKLYVSGKSYYDIVYDAVFHDKTFEQRKSTQHEFLFYRDEDQVLEGVLVYKNKMTELMVEYLLSDPDELVKVSGTSTAQHYRYLTMLNLSKLWD